MSATSTKRVKEQSLPDRFFMFHQSYFRYSYTIPFHNHHITKISLSLLSEIWNSLRVRIDGSCLKYFKTTLISEYHDNKLCCHVKCQTFFQRISYIFLKFSVARLQTFFDFARWWLSIANKSVTSYKQILLFCYNYDGSRATKFRGSKLTINSKISCIVSS